MSGAGDETVLGIDFGTTYSCAAFLREGKPKIVPSEKGYATVPSVVGRTRKGEIVVGQAAMDQMVVKPEETVYGAKRLIGRKFNSLIVQRMREKMAYSIVGGPNDEAAVMLGSTLYTLPQVSALILGEIREVAQRYLAREIRKAVITVPAYYSDNQRAAVRQAGEIAALEVERIVNEPTAAALAYGYNRGFDQNVLVYDLGGGTFDMSVLKIQGNDFEVLATGGDTFLGGVDFDQRIVDFVLHQFGELAGKDLRQERVAVERVRAAAERAKRALSTERVARIELPYITQVEGEPLDLNVSLLRDQLNRLTVDLIEQTLRICDRVLKTGGIEAAGIDEILLVGGQTRMPLVREMIEKHFNKVPRKGVHPDEVVAAGAAILGGNLEASGVRLKDVLSMPIGVALPSGNYKVVLERNTPVPSAKSYKVAVPAGRTLEIDVYQGENPSILDNEYLGTFKFPPAPKGSGKAAATELRFELSAECLLTVHVKKPESGGETSTKMTTLQTPKSLKARLAAEAEARKGDRLLFSFARRILGR